LGGPIFASKSTRSTRDFRVLDEQMLLLHGFIKKTQNTPKADIDLATKRMKEMKK
jgi:phage-related protein